MSESLPPESIMFRGKVYDLYGTYDRKFKLNNDIEALKSQNEHVRTHVVSWNYNYNLYTKENRK